MTSVDAKSPSGAGADTRLHLAAVYGGIRSHEALDTGASDGMVELCQRKKK